MTRILLIETASPRRVMKKAREIIEGGAYPSPEVTILCRPDAHSVEHLGTIPGARLVPWESNTRRKILRDLKQEQFDLAILFWTGEKEYRPMKRVALRLFAREKQVEIGDGHSMRLTLGNFLRFLPIRWKHPLPSDHDLYRIRPETKAGQETPAEKNYIEEVLILQSAEPAYVLRTLESLKASPIFRAPRFTLFCRNRPEVLNCFRGHPLIHRIISHSETRSAWRHLMELRSLRFHTVMVFFTGDPSYWKIKYFTFLVGARHKLIYNEFDGCFFFNWKSMNTHLTYRLREHCRLGASPRRTNQIRLFVMILVKILMLPFRFLWLLGVWLWLRCSSLRGSD